MSDYSELVKQLRQATDGFIHHEAADALEAQAIRIAELEAELSACQRGNDSYHDQSILEHNRAVDMKLRIEDLEAALKEALDYIDDPYNDLAIQIGELLDRAALKGEKGHG